MLALARMINEANLKPIQSVRRLEEVATAFADISSIAAPTVNDPGASEKKLRVVLITEGLGNRVNMNYYGREAIESAPWVFEGKPAFIDHPSRSDESDIPERRVRDKCGYFKNCKVEKIGGVLACVGDLHFDLSEAGREGYLKALTALHYRQEFPGAREEYVGLSINANGDVEDRTVTWEGERVDVHYVTRFTDAVSCDVVTSPARGGRFLALVESAAGAKTKRKEDVKMLKDTLKAAHAALEAASKEADPVKAKAMIVEATAKFNAVLTEATQVAERTEEASTAAEESRAAAEEALKKADEAKKAAEKKAKQSKSKEMDDEKDDEEDEDKVEAVRLAVVGMIKEAKLDKFVKIEEFKGMSLKDAKAAIESKKNFRDAFLAEAAKALSVPVAAFQKLNESEAGAGGADGDILKSCLRD